MYVYICICMHLYTYLIIWSMCVSIWIVVTCSLLYLENKSRSHADHLDCTYSSVTNQQTLQRDSALVSCPSYPLPKSEKAFCSWIKWWIGMGWWVLSLGRVLGCLVWWILQIDLEFRVFRKRWDTWEKSINHTYSIRFLTNFNNAWWLSHPIEKYELNRKSSPNGVKIPQKNEKTT